MALTATPPAREQVEVWGTFKIIQNGVEMAGGSGPLEAIRREAEHYAAVYAQDGPATVRVRKTRRRVGA